MIPKRFKDAGDERITPGDTPGAGDRNCDDAIRNLTHEKLDAAYPPGGEAFDEAIERLMASVTCEPSRS